MHFLTLSSAVELGPKDKISAGKYVVDDVSAAHLLVLAGGGRMEPAALDVNLATREEWNGARILFMRAGGFGDLVLLTPVLRAVKARYPDAKIHVSTMAHYACVFKGLPFVDACVPYPMPAADLLGYDACIFYENTVERNPRAQTLHMTELFAEVAGVRCIDNLRPAYHVSTDETRWAAEKYPRVNGTRRICVQIGTSAFCRAYPRNQMGEVMGALLRRGWEVFVLGAPREVQLPGRLPPTLKNLCMDDLTFRQSSAVLAGADVFLGSDSALLHVAGALGVPAVGLYGPFPWKLRTAHCPNTVALSGVGPCAPCFHHVNSARKNNFPEACPSRGAGVCQVLADIKPERIVARVEAVAGMGGDAQ